MDLVEFYHEAERYLCQEDTKSEKAEVDALDDGGLSDIGFSKDEGKRKVDDFGGSKR